MGEGARVFIAGAHTYLGSRVAAVFQERDYDVVCLAHENQETYPLEAIGVEIVRGSILEPDTWKNVLKRCEFALNLHRHLDLRGDPEKPLRGAKGRDEQRFVKTLRAINVDGAVNFLDACTALDVPKVLTVNSALALGDHRGSVVDETAEHRRRFRSHFEKSMYDALFQTRRRIEEGARVACVLPGPILGPHAEGPFTQLVENFVTGRLGWGLESRSAMTFTYIDDIVRAIFQLLDKRAPTGLYVIGNEPISWQEFFRKLEKVSGVTPKDGWRREGVAEALVRSRSFWRGAPGKDGPIPREIWPYMFDSFFMCTSARAKREFGWDDTTMEIWMAELVEEVKSAHEGPATQAAIETLTPSKLPAGY